MPNTPAPEATASLAERIQANRATLTAPAEHVHECQDTVSISNILTGLLGGLLGGLSDRALKTGVTAVVWEKG